MTHSTATLVTPDTVAVLRRKLDDPAVAEALGQLLDHADLLALMVTGLDGLVRRSETVGDSVIAGLDELRAGAGPVADLMADLDLAGLARSLATLSRILVDSAPALDRLLKSDLVAPATVDTVALAGRALTRGYAKAQANHASVTGLRAVLRLLKDPDVGRGLGFLAEVARSLGQELRASEPSPGARGPRAGTTPTAGPGLPTRSGS